MSYEDNSTFDEVWKDVPGYEGCYQVSSHGRVKSMARTVLGSDGVYQRVRERILKPGVIVRVGNTGYTLFVNLYRNNKPKPMVVARLVLTAFVGPCPEGMEACHFPSNDTLNNRLDNLMWGTHTTNMNHREEQGTGSKGERHPLAKLTAPDIVAIRELMAAGANRFELAKQYGVTETTIRDICKRRSWSHVA